MKKILKIALITVALCGIFALVYKICSPGPKGELTSSDSTEVNTSIKQLKDTAKNTDVHSDTIRTKEKQEVSEVVACDTLKDFIYKNLKSKHFDVLQSIVDGNTLKIIKKYSNAYPMEATYNSQGVIVNIDSPELIVLKATNICQVRLRGGINFNLRDCNYKSINTYDVYNSISTTYKDEIAYLMAQNIIDNIFPQDMNLTRQQRFFDDVLSTYNVYDKDLNQIVTGFSSWQEVVDASRGKKKRK